MKKLLPFTLAAIWGLCTCLSLSAANIDEATARQRAAAFLQHRTTALHQRSATPSSHPGTPSS
ncbi:MAG: hypothetical protein J5545_13225, partial [Bacteroidaceae bacterium]|nr:hypothetical protein [Bacteroidaceae bacterium]